MVFLLQTDGLKHVKYCMRTSNTISAEADDTSVTIKQAWIEDLTKLYEKDDFHNQLNLDEHAYQAWFSLEQKL